MPVIALIGSTGPTGQEAIKECIQRGWTVRAILRDPSKLTVHDESVEVQLYFCSDNSGVLKVL